MKMHPKPEQNKNSNAVTSEFHMQYNSFNFRLKYVSEHGLYIFQTILPIIAPEKMVGSLV